MPCRLIVTIGLFVAVVLTSARCGGDDEARADLAFVTTRDGDYAVYEMSADGGAQRRLTDADPDSSTAARLLFQIEPSWSPDGTKIAFSSRRSGTFDIYVMNADGTGTRRLTSTRDNDTHPTWSPDGVRLAFARGDDLYVMNADGSGPRQISDETVEEREPAWSPDGSWIAYVRRTPGTPVREVWLVRPDSSQPHQLTRLGASTYTPAWSPDGRRLAFATNVENVQFDIYTIGVDGKGLRRVTVTADDSFEPAWSPDGKTIAYSEGGSIYSDDVDRDIARRLTEAKNNDFSPAWNPRPPREED